MDGAPALKFPLDLPLRPVQSKKSCRSPIPYIDLEYHPHRFPLVTASGSTDFHTSFPLSSNCKWCSVGPRCRSLPGPDKRRYCMRFPSGTPIRVREKSHYMHRPFLALWGIPDLVSHPSTGIDGFAFKRDLLRLNHRKNHSCRIRRDMGPEQKTIARSSGIRSDKTRFFSWNLMMYDSIFPRLRSIFT